MRRDIVGRGGCISLNSTPPKTRAPPIHPINTIVSPNTNQANNAANTGSVDKMRPTRAGVVKGCKCTWVTTAPAVAKTAKNSNRPTLAGSVATTMPPSTTDAEPSPKTATVATCTKVSKTGSKRAANRSMRTMWSANMTAQANTTRSPSSGRNPTCQSTVIRAKPTVATPTPSHVTQVDARPLMNLAKIGMKTTLSAVMKPALAADVYCKPIVCNKYPEPKTIPINMP